MSVPGEIAAAYRAGQASWSARDAVNPWNGIGPTARERVLASVWRRGRLSMVSPAFRSAR